MKSTQEEIIEPLLDPESLKRHFNFVNPASYNLALFQISNLLNEKMNEDTQDVKKGREKLSKKALRKLKQLGDKFPVFTDVTQILNDVLAEKEKPRNPMNVVANGLVLGVIPKASQIDEMINTANDGTHPVKSIDIFSITDEFEQGMPEMLQPKDLAKSRSDVELKHHQVPMTDFGAEITPQSILAAVYKMRQIIENGGEIYIHCKAGKARSAMIVATYLAIYGDEKNNFIIDNTDPINNPPLKQAVAYLKEKRSQVNLHDEDVDWKNFMEQNGSFSKLQKAQETINLHQALAKKLQHDTSIHIKTKDYILQFNKETKNGWNNIEWKKAPVKNSMIKTIINQILKNEKDTSWEYKNGNSPFSSLEFKNKIIHSTSFKQLKIYATQSQNLFKKTSKRTQYVNEFLKSIYTAENDNWYKDLQEKKGPLWNLYHNSKVPEDIKKTIQLFISDLSKYENELQKSTELVKPMESLANKTMHFTQNQSHYNQNRLFAHSRPETSLKIEIFKLINEIEKQNENKTMNSETKEMLSTLKEKLDKIKMNTFNHIEDRKDVNKIAEQIYSSKKALTMK